MPTRNIRETPGGTTEYDMLAHDISVLKAVHYGPDWKQTTVKTAMISEDFAWWNIPAGGWLISVCILAADDNNMPANEEEYRARFEITDPAGTALWGQFTWEYPLSSCGMTFSVPIPNMDTSIPYSVNRISKGTCPRLKMITTNLLPKRH